MERRPPTGAVDGVRYFFGRRPPLARQASSVGNLVKFLTEE
jgi:hypothetical protein